MEKTPNDKYRVAFRYTVLIFCTLLCGVLLMATSFSFGWKGVVLGLVPGLVLGLLGFDWKIRALESLIVSVVGPFLVLVMAAQDRDWWVFVYWLFFTLFFVAGSIIFSYLIQRIIDNAKGEPE